jgi:hypothetical protein
MAKRMLSQKMNWYMAGSSYRKCPLHIGRLLGIKTWKEIIESVSSKEIDQ